MQGSFVATFKIWTFYLKRITTFRPNCQQNLRFTRFFTLI